MSLAITIESPQLAAVEQRVRKLAAGLGDATELLEALGAELESQTRRRIDSSGPAPDGTPWPAWSDAYERTRHSGQSLLQAEGGLLDSIQSLVSGDLLETGSNLIYAAIHQFGGTADMPAGPAAVPAREWLGLGGDEERGLDGAIDAWLSEIAAEALA